MMEEVTMVEEELNYPEEAKAKPPNIMNFMESMITQNDNILRKKNVNFREDSPSVNVLLTHKKIEVVDDQIWYIYSGISNHIIRKKNLFLKLEDNISKQVKFGDNNHVSIIENGSFTFKENTGKIIQMHYTLYVTRDEA